MPSSLGLPTTSLQQIRQTAEREDLHWLHCRLVETPSASYSLPLDQVLVSELVRKLEPMDRCCCSSSAAGQ